MNRTLLGCVVLAAFMVVGLFAGPEALAQRGPKHHEPGERLDRHIEMMDERLDLTDEQETQIRALLEEHAAEMQAWREDADSSTREERRTHMRESMMALREDVGAVLTAEQKETLETLHARMQERRDDRRDRREHWSEHRREHRSEDLIEELDLSDAQTNQLQSLRESHRAEMKEWRAANPDATREALRERMRLQAEEHRAAMMEILTDEQRQVFEEMRAERQERREEWQERRDEKEREWRGRHRQKQDGEQ